MSDPTVNIVSPFLCNWSVLIFYLKLLLHILIFTTHTHTPVYGITHYEQAACWI